MEQVKQVRVVVKEPNKQAEERLIDNTLRGYQKAVDGWIESVCLPQHEDNIDIVMNDEGKLLNMETNVYVDEYKDFFVGTLVAVGVNKNDLTWRSLTDEEIKCAIKWFDEHDIRNYYKKVDNGNTIYQKSII